jgi:hypothetical protein
MDTCCSGRCVNTNDDPSNCGGCGNKCTGSKPFCELGNCITTPCAGQACMTSQSCCGVHCCDKGQLCCATDPLAEPYCFTPTSTETTCS